MIFQNGYDWNYLSQQFLTNGVARVAVPFFAMISGFFLFSRVQKSNDYLNTLKKRMTTLLLPYLIGALFVFLSSAILDSILWPEKSPSLDLYKAIKLIRAHPVAFQFWFLRDLIILTIVSPAIFSIKKIANYLLGFILAFV